MGREAKCECAWGHERGACHVMLEPSELIVRGAVRRRVPLASLTDIQAREDELTFRAGAEMVSLHLGTDIANKWAVAMVKRPPTLARKLGITADSRVWLIGDPSSEELMSALGEAQAISRQKPGMVIFSVRTPVELENALEAYDSLMGDPLPIWIVYPKGTGQALGEALVRDSLRSRGMMDVKVASISMSLTATRFLAALRNPAAQKVRQV